MFVSVAVLILIQSVCVAPVTVTSSSPRVQVLEYSDAKLSCEFKTEREKNPRIEWKKKDKDVSFVYFEGHFKGPFRSRAEIDGATVLLHRVTQADAGEYRCEVSAPLDTVTLGETNITLEVLVPPHTPSCDIPSSALTGSQVELRCSDQHSIPPAVYTWYKDKKPLLIRHANDTFTINKFTGMLIFQKVSKTDAGQYHCEANNKVGPPKSCEAKHMQIDDLNLPAVITGVVLVCLIGLLCAFGVCYAHRQGYFSRHRGSQHSGYSHTPQEFSFQPQDFKHKQSFML
ncbi:junctional adhesion molecule 2A isoform X1 [Myxocyprinus asiaticus]|uniref:junctional adhesion molecule 2A isoform X1 n=1 Tax=Myxocyprinus asiaticus TaxID=70543 RepID=UPI0022218D44|nr:junctional adhesion molecule 2A isoform X1 [Myxocyprinus asiaticus]